MADTYQLQWTPRGGQPIKLAAALVSHNATWGMRLASHGYIKRDGAEQEPMGAEPARVTYRLTFVGVDFALRYRTLITAIRKEPRGTLVDPLAGTLHVACRGISDASRNLRDGKNAVDVTVVFEEDALDAALVVEAATSPTKAVATAKAKRNAAKSTSDDSTATAGTQGAAAASAVATWLAKTDTVLSALDAAVSGASDVAATIKLAAAGKAGDVAIAALTGSATGGVGARAYAVVSRIVDCYAACVEAERVISGAQPDVISYTVEGQTALWPLCARLYGAGEAQQRATTILGMNRMVNTLAIPAGTVLRVPTPTNA